MNAGTIIMPIAGKSSRFPNMRPKWMLTAPTGELMLELSLRTIPNWESHRVVIGALKEHLHAMGGLGAIRRALGDHPEIVEFDDVTDGPAATVNEILERAGVSGPIFVKDCDSWFATPENLFESLVCYADLRTTPDVSNVPGKSFIMLNDSGVVNGIFEKVVCSTYISVGGYGFRNAELFTEAFSRLKQRGSGGEPFVSHVVLEAIQAGEVFQGASVDGYVDVGTLEAWQRFRDRYALYLVDLDGVVFRNAGAFLQPLWSEPDVPLEENVAKLRSLSEGGAQIVFVTARPLEYKEKTEATLHGLGLKWKDVVYGVNHCQRILINDFAPSNPYPSAVAINLPRNADTLANYL